MKTAPTPLPLRVNDEYVVLDSTFASVNRIPAPKTTDQATFIISNSWHLQAENGVGEYVDE